MLSVPCCEQAVLLTVVDELVVEDVDLENKTTRHQSNTFNQRVGRQGYAPVPLIWSYR